NPMARADYMSTRIGIYEALADALVDEQRYLEALDVAERLKGRSMADAIAEHGEGLALTPEEKEQEKALNQRIVELNRALVRETNREAEAKIREELRGARASLEVFHSTMQVRHTRGVNETVPDDLDEVIKATRGTVVEYSVSTGRRRVTAYVIRGGHVT